MKNKKGFTLIEIMVTIGIIIILSSILTFSLVNYFSKAQGASNSVESHQNKYDAAKSSVAALDGVSGAAASPTATATPAVTFIVTFADWDGTVLKTQSVTSGSSATAPADPVRKDYIFSSWDVSYTNITSALTVTAVYTTTPITAVTISGTFKKDKTLTANTTPTGASATYQWQIASSSTGTWANISGATSKTYKLPDNSNNNSKYIRVIATGTGGYSGSIVTSAAGGPIG